MKTIYLILMSLAMVACSVAMTACGVQPVQPGKPVAVQPPTPVQVYNGVQFADAAIYDGALAYNATGKMPDADWQAIQAGHKTVLDTMAKALAWMQANPALANTPGAAIPAFDPAAIIGATLKTYADKYGIQFPAPVTIPVPTTQP